MLRLRHSRPYSPFPPLFPRFFVYYRHLDRRFEPGARSPLHGEILCFGLVPLHVCSILRARVLVGHCGRTLVSEKGQWMSFWSPSAWCRPAYSQTASVCHSLSQQPDCQRLPLFIPTARLPAFATLYPNSHVAFRHGIHRWLGFLLSRLSPLDPYRIIFTNGLGTFRDRSILRAMVSFVRRGVTLIHMELLPLYTWSCCPYSHLHGCTASG